MRTAQIHEPEKAPWEQRRDQATKDEITPGIGDTGWFVATILSNPVRVNIRSIEFEAMFK